MKTLFCKSVFFVIICLLANSVFLSAQESQSTAEEIETLLNTGVVTYAQASRFVLEAANVLAASDPKEAFDYAMQQKWLPKNVSADGLARLDHISLLLMSSFNVKGGIMYSITKNSRYAYRELVYLNVIQYRADPAMPVSGERLLFVVGRLIGESE